MDEQKLFEDNIKLCYYAVNKFKQNVYDKEDMIQTAMIGLWKACKSYDESRGIKFSGYAMKCINNELLMQMRHANTYGYKLETSLDKIDDETGLSLIDMIADELDMETIIERCDLYRSLEKCMDALTDRERLYINMYYKEGYTQKEISNICQVSQAYVSRVIGKSLIKLRCIYNKLYGDYYENSSKVY